jgi:hypothetical protein
MPINEEKLQAFMKFIHNLTYINTDMACEFAHSAFTIDAEFREYFIEEVSIEADMLLSLISYAKHVEEEESAKLPANVIPFRKVR